MPITDLPRHENLIPAAAIIMGAVDYGRRGLINAVKDLTPEQLSAKPAGFGNSIATLLMHIATTEVGFSHMIMGKKVTEELSAEYPRHMPGTPLPEPAAGTTAAELLAKLEKSRGFVFEALSGLKEGDLTREVSFGPDRGATVQWMMGILGNHQSQHYGHIQMIVKHL